MKIATLGPKGTFSEQAVNYYLKDAGKKAEIIFSSNISDVFNLVNNDIAEYGVVPLENLIDGSIGETLDLLYHSNLFVISEIIIKIHHCIASTSNSLKEIKNVMSISKALNQCLGFIRKNRLATIESLSTAEAMRLVSEKKQNDLAAIGPEIAAKEYRLKILQKNIEDKKNNVTRFVVISKEKNKKGKGEYKTSMVIHPTKDRPGLLRDLLESFSKRNINLTKIESRPTKLKLGEYLFYVDIEGHEEDLKIKEAFKEIEKLATIKVFGSYIKRY